MQKLTIDLLPAEFKAQEIKKNKFYRIQSIGVAVVLLTSFLASMTIALRILQNQQIKRAQARFDEASQKVTDLRTTQGYLLLLKNRLTTINQYLGTASKQAQMYSLVEKLLPGSVSLNTISVEKTGETLILGTSIDANALDLFLNNLLSKETNQNKIKGVNMETFNRGKDGIYRISLKIIPN